MQLAPVGIVRILGSTERQSTTRSPSLAISSLNGFDKISLALHTLGSVGAQAGLFASRPTAFTPCEHPGIPLSPIHSSPSPGWNAWSLARRTHETPPVFYAYVSARPSCRGSPGHPSGFFWPQVHHLCAALELSV